MKSNPGNLPTKILILQDIRSAQNVGALFRTADACGIEMIYLSDTTPTPVDRFDRPNPQIAKTALGAELVIPWKQYGRITTLISQLKKRGVVIVAVEQASVGIPSMDYKKVHKQIAGKSVAFILGNEVEGVPLSVLKLCDIVTEIPMKGTKESLNVSVAGGIVLFTALAV